MGTHAQLLTSVPQYRYLLAADDELDDRAERSCAWEDDKNRERLEQAYEEQEATDAACAKGRFVASEAEDDEATEVQPIDVPDDEWRGRFDEDRDDLPIDESAPRRREARALLWSLLRPYR